MCYRSDLLLNVRVDCYWILKSISGKIFHFPIFYQKILAFDKTVWFDTVSESHEKFGYSRHTIAFCCKYMKSRLTCHEHEDRKHDEKCAVIKGNKWSVLPITDNRRSFWEFFILFHLLQLYMLQPAFIVNFYCHY